MDTLVTKIPQWAVIIAHLVTLVTVLYIAYKAVRIFRLGWRQKNDQKEYFEEKLKEIKSGIQQLKHDSDVDFLISQTRASRKLSRIRIQEIEKQIARVHQAGRDRKQELEKLHSQLKQHQERVEKIDINLNLLSESYQTLTELQYSDEDLFSYFESELLPQSSSLTLIEHESELQHLDSQELNRQSARLARSRAYDLGLGALWDSWYVDRLENRSNFTTTH